MHFQWQYPVCQKVKTHSKTVSKHKKSHKERYYRCKKYYMEFIGPDNFKRHLATCLI